jgi:hypothetical protein
MFAGLRRSPGCRVRPRCESTDASSAGVGGRRVRMAPKTAEDKLTRERVL